jgi:hypothetical protein
MVNPGLDIAWQLQRVRGQLIHKKRVKTEDSSANDTVPLCDICSTALKLRRDQQATIRETAGDRWQASDLVFTAKWGHADRAPEIQPQLRHPLRQGRRRADPGPRHPAHLCVAPVNRQSCIGCITGGDSADRVITVPYGMQESAWPGALLGDQSVTAGQA